jgi:hypothetical protein
MVRAYGLAAESLEVWHSSMELRLVSWTHFHCVLFRPRSGKFNFTTSSPTSGRLSINHNNGKIYDIPQ